MIEEYCKRGKPQTQADKRRQLGRPVWDLIKPKRLVETTAADFIALLTAGGANVHHQLKCVHNLALGYGWLPWPVLQPKVWPAVRHKPKRGILAEEHRMILESEKNPERRMFYEFLWEVGAAQSDAAHMYATNIDWPNRVLRYRRMKTAEWACLAIGPKLEELLRRLPSSGALFPAMQKLSNAHRSAEFCRRCRVAGVKGVSLHSYRYAWAERAKACGYPERFAQSALGHNSRAVHQAYAKGATPTCPALDQFEAEMRSRLIPLPRVGQAAVVPAEGCKAVEIMG